MLSDEVAEILKESDGLSIEEIASELFGTASADPRNVNLVRRTLFAGHRRYKRPENGSDRWMLIEYDTGREFAELSREKGAAGADKSRRIDLVQARSRLGKPYQWQLEALQSWELNGRRGVVEAVTGSGKTMVGILAIFEALESSSKVHVVVPTIDLQRQWFDRLHKALPSQIAIGRRGGGFSSEFSAVDVLISVVNSSRGEFLDFTPIDGGLLIADECHRYASAENSAVLSEKFAWRLGLTATFRRQDNAHNKYLVPYFENICYSLNYEDAHDSQVIADYGAVFLGVNLTGYEMAEYQQLSDDIGTYLAAFRRLTKDDFHDYFALIEALLDAASGKFVGVDQKCEDIARLLLGHMRKRRRLLEFASAKIGVLPMLGQEILASNGTIVFTQSIEVAVKAAQQLNEIGIKSSALHSKIHRDIRRFQMQEFAEKKIKAIIAPKILDEGIDFPDADLAIVLAASSTRRQMVQRMGRVLRPKSGGDLARFVVVFASDTVEDPMFGGHNEFINDLRSGASVSELVESHEIGRVLEILKSIRIS